MLSLSISPSLAVAMMNNLWLGITPLFKESLRVQGNGYGE